MKYKHTYRFDKTFYYNVQLENGSLIVNQYSDLTLTNSVTTQILYNLSVHEPYKIYKNKIKPMFLSLFHFLKSLTKVLHCSLLINTIQTIEEKFLTL